jgi:hypothetical protein
MKTTEKHYVEFYSPGTFVSEASEREIGEWDTREAVRIAATITERHGAIPFGFRFYTRLVAEDVPDGRGGWMKVDPKKLRESPMHYIDGRLMTLEDVERDDPGAETLIWNMRVNKIARVVTGPVNGKGWRWTHEWHDGCRLLDADGTDVTP